jgi:hypothetical protein
VVREMGRRLFAIVSGVGGYVWNGDVCTTVRGSWAVRRLVRVLGYEKAEFLCLDGLIVLPLRCRF